MRRDCENIAMMRFAGRLDDGQFVCNPPAETYERVRLVCRGFVANSDEILKEAARRGAPIRPDSVGECLALAYRLWGDALQNHVVGEYSLALFDENISTLVLTHDA